MSNYTIQSTALNKSRVFILQKSELEKRFDPQFYINRVKIKNSVKLSTLVKVKGGKRIPKGKYYSETPTEYQYLRVSDMQDFGLINWDGLKFIPEDVYYFLERYKVKKGDVIISIAGTVGKTALIEKEIKNTILTENCAVLEIRDKSILLPKYLHILLELSTSRRQIELGFIQTTIPKLGFDKIEQLQLPEIPSIAKQLEIIAFYDKSIAQKQTNEAEADKLLSSIDDYLLNELGIKLPEPPENTLKNRMFVATLQQITGGRFDPKLYSTQSKELIKSLYKTSFKYQTLKSVIIQSCSGDWGNDDKEVYNENEFVRCLVIRATEFDNKFNLNVDGSRAKYRLINKPKYKALDIRENDLLIEKSGGSENQPVGRIAILTKELTDSYSLGFSNFVHKFRVNDNVVNPEFVFNYLKTIHNIKITDVMQSQTNGIRNLILNEYLSLPIPVPPLDKQKEIAEHITGIRQQAQQLKDKTTELLKKASEEIEEILLSE